MRRIFQNWTYDIPIFLREHGEGRITQAALDYYAHEPTDKYWFVGAFEDYDPAIVSVSLAALVDGEVKYGVTVTHKDHRQKLYGSTLLKAKVRLMRADGIHYRTIVAEDNEASKRMCSKAALIITGEETRIRKRGEYRALVFEGKK